MEGVDERGCVDRAAWGGDGEAGIVTGTEAWSRSAPPSCDGEHGNSGILASTFIRITQAVRSDHRRVLGGALNPAGGDCGRGTGRPISPTPDRPVCPV